jgi:crotonobetainyl-CoA:carnitine CoA-transferase CaiB-like acyl-CoA transferase
VQPETGPLHGYTVVELSTGIAGAYCTKPLADGGAQVIKVQSPQGDPIRSWSASGAHIESGSDGALFGFLDCSKHGVVADPAIPGDVEFVNELLAAAGTVVWSRGSAVADCDAFTPAALPRSHPHPTVTAITPFGLEGPWRDRPATEFTLQAWSGGIVGLGRGSPDRAPVFVGGQVGGYLAATGRRAAIIDAAPEPLPAEPI